MFYRKKWSYYGRQEGLERRFVGSGLDFEATSERSTSKKVDGRKVAFSWSLFAQS